MALYERFEDWWVRGWSWRLARDPFTDAVQLPNSSPSIYLLKSSQNHADLGFPFTLTFMYSATDQYVDLIDVRFVAISIGDDAEQRVAQP